MQMIMQRRSSSLQFGILPGNIPGESTRLKISLSGGRGYPEGIDAFHPSRIGKKLAQKKWAQGGRKVKLPKTSFCGNDIPPKSIPLSVYHHDKLSATHLFTHRRVRTRKLTGLRPRPELQAPKARQHTSLGNHHLILLEG
jgi:hypothetical protein